jgi:hypothetical protein
MNPLHGDQPFADYVLTLHLTSYNVTSVKNGGMLSEESREQESRKLGVSKFS